MVGGLLGSTPATREPGPYFLSTKTNPGEDATDNFLDTIVTTTTLLDRRKEAFAVGRTPCPRNNMYVHIYVRMTLLATEPLPLGRCKVVYFGREKEREPHGTKANRATDNIHRNNNNLNFNQVR